MDLQTFKHIFLPLNRLLYVEAVRILHDSSDAQDAVQDTYVRLWEHREDLDGVENCRAYAVAILRNRCFSITRAQVENTTSLNPNSTEDQVLSLSDDIEARDRLQVALGIIDGLPENQRRVILLHDIEGFSHEEIEEQTGLSSVNVRQLLSRARKAIRSKFSK